MRSINEILEDFLPMATFEPIQYIGAITIQWNALEGMIGDLCVAYLNDAPLSEIILPPLTIDSRFALLRFLIDRNETGPKKDYALAVVKCSETCKMNRNTLIHARVSRLGGEVFNFTKSPSRREIHSRKEQDILLQQLRAVEREIAVTTNHIGHIIQAVYEMNPPEEPWVLPEPPVVVLLDLPAPTDMTVYYPPRP